MKSVDAMKSSFGRSRSGNEVYQVTREGGHNAKWRADGRELFYIATDGTMMSCAIDTTHGFEVKGITKLFKVPSPRAVAGRWQQYDVSKEGSGFLMIVPDPQLAQAITVVLNWPALPK